MDENLNSPSSLPNQTSKPLTQVPNSNQIKNLYGSSNPSSLSNSPSALPQNNLEALKPTYTPAPIPLNSNSRGLFNPLSQIKSQPRPTTPQPLPATNQPQTPQNQTETTQSQGGNRLKDGAEDLVKKNRLRMFIAWLFTTFIALVPWIIAFVILLTFVGVLFYGGGKKACEAFLNIEKKYEEVKASAKKGLLTVDILDWSKGGSMLENQDIRDYFFTFKYETTALENMGELAAKLGINEEVIRNVLIALALGFTAVTIASGGIAAVAAMTEFITAAGATLGPAGIAAITPTVIAGIIAEAAVLGAEVFAARLLQIIVQKIGQAFSVFVYGMLLKFIIGFVVIDYIAKSESFDKLVNGVTEAAGKALGFLTALTQGKLDFNNNQLAGLDYKNLKYICSVLFPQLEEAILGCAGAGSTVGCIGKLLDAPGDTITFWKKGGSFQQNNMNISDGVPVKKTTIKSIIAESEKAKISVRTIRMILAKFVNEVLDPDDPWGAKAGGVLNGDCLSFGIAQLCTDSIISVAKRGLIDSKYINNPGSIVDSRTDQLRAVEGYLQEKAPSVEQLAKKWPSFISKGDYYGFVKGARVTKDQFLDAHPEYKNKQDELWPAEKITLKNWNGGGGQAELYAEAAYENYKRTDCAELTKTGNTEVPKVAYVDEIKSKNEIFKTKDNVFANLFKWFGVESQAQDAPTLITPPAAAAPAAGCASKSGVISGNGVWKDKMSQFITQFSGKRTPDPNGQILGQCVSLSKQWQYFIGVPFGIWPGGDDPSYSPAGFFPNAYKSSDWGLPIPSFASWERGQQGMAPPAPGYTIVKLGGNGLGNADVEKLEPGDLVVLRPGSGFTTHTGIATGNKNATQYELFDQNWDAKLGAPRLSKYDKVTFWGAFRYIKK
jgi:hypothetical protein